MISICCCAINSKYDVDLFVKTLHLHNPGTDFEICLTLDDRVDDGSREHFELLATTYPKLRLLYNTHQDTVDYLTALLTYYDQRELFTAEFRTGLRRNLAAFERRELFDHNQAFLWLTSGVLYNKAVQASRGDLLIVTPADFIYLFGLDQIQALAEKKARDGRFYVKPWATFCRISNLPYNWLAKHVGEVHRGQYAVGNPWRWDTQEVFRDYLRCPTPPEEYYLLDFYNERLISLADSQFINYAAQCCRDGKKTGGIQMIPNFHGFHCMTRKTYDLIGGFTEEFYGRAFADDKMTYLGLNNEPPGHSALQPEISVGWVGAHELLVTAGPGYPLDWRAQLTAHDPYYGRHPNHPITGHRYLHTGIVDDNTHMAKLVNATFSRNTRPVRICV